MVVLHGSGAPATTRTSRGHPAQEQSPTSAATLYAPAAVSVDLNDPTSSMGSNPTSTGPRAAARIRSPPVQDVLLPNESRGKTRTITTSPAMIVAGAATSTSSASASAVSKSSSFPPIGSSIVSPVSSSTVSSAIRATHALGNVGPADDGAVVGVVGRVGRVLDRDDAHVVRPRGRRAQPNLPGPVPELDVLAVARARAFDLRAEAVQTAAVLREVSEPIAARDAHRAGGARDPPRHHLRGVDVAVRRGHRAGVARNGDRPRRRVIRLVQDDRDLHLPGFRDRVRELVRAVAVVDGFSEDHFPVGRPRFQEQRRAAAVDSVPAVIPRLARHRRFLAGDAELRAAAAKRGRREGHFESLGGDVHRRARDVLAVEHDGDAVPPRV
eukprot:31510-Pelagococcus_subviridis.AAC.19